MNCLLGETSVEMQVNYLGMQVDYLGMQVDYLGMQVDYLGTRLTGEAQEWFYRNVE